MKWPVIAISMSIFSNVHIHTEMYCAVHSSYTGFYSYFTLIHSLCGNEIKILLVNGSRNESSELTNALCGGAFRSRSISLLAGFLAFTPAQVFDALRPRSLATCKPGVQPP